MRSFMEEYEYWLQSDAVDEDTKSELRDIADQSQELESRFKSMMKFGTSGLRGVMKAGTRNMNIYTVRYATQAMANLIVRAGGHQEGHHQEGSGVVIGHDSRINSRLYAEETARVLAANGIKSYLFEDLRPTPELSYAIRKLGAISGINITASHNTREYNGYKVYWADGAQLSTQRAKSVAAELDSFDIFRDVRLMDFAKAQADGLVELIGSEIDAAYLECVLEQSVGQDIVSQVADDVSIVYTPFHGAGYRLVPETLRRIGIKHIIPVEEQMILDGNFPTVKSPNPEIPEGFQLGIQYARRNNADMVIGTDPDSDRCGCVVRHDGDYRVLSGNEMACLMMDYMFTIRSQEGTLPDNAVVCKSIVSSLMPDIICRRFGVKLVEVFTGFRFIGEKIRMFEDAGELQFVFGYEESIGFLAGTYARDKDAVVAAMLMAEVCCYYKSRGMSVYDGVLELYEKYGYCVEDTKFTVYEGFDAQERMADVMTGLRAEPPAEVGLKVLKIRDYLEGVPGFESSNVLFYELADGCAVAVRPSGTEPKVKTYVLAQGASRSEAQARCQTIRLAIDNLLS